MTTRFNFLRRRTPADTAAPLPGPTADASPAEPAPPKAAPAILPMPISPNDPLVAYFQHNSAPVELSRLNLDSPVLERLRAEGVALVVPLVSQGELVGMINMGPRMSEQEYTSEDRKLLGDLSSQAGPAVRVAQLVRQQQIEALERERMETELRVARVIQQTLLPQELPELEQWKVGALWQPARAVSGDFYDFVQFRDGRLAIIIADVTDKGVPAALVMATTRSILRAAAERLVSPGAVLERTNEVLCPDIPPKMFVTCFYALLDPVTGYMCYANAGQNLPFVQRQGVVDELRATGMPLGLLPGMGYEEKETILHPGDRLLLYSDGLVEAHNRQREMFSTPRLRNLLAEHCGDTNLVQYLLDQMHEFTGPDLEQEDDVTFVTVEHLPAPESVPANEGWEVLDSFELPSEPGNERQAMHRVAAIVAGIGLAVDRLEKLKTAVAEGAMNAMEHGNHYEDGKPVTIAVLRSPTALAVRITDQGGGRPIPTADTPDLDAKLAGLQSPRGWGLFLIRSMVDDMNIISDERHHTLELIFFLDGGTDGHPTS